MVVFILGLCTVCILLWVGDCKDLGLKEASIHLHHPLIFLSNTSKRRLHLAGYLVYVCVYIVCVCVCVCT